MIYVPFGAVDEVGIQMHVHSNLMCVCVCIYCVYIYIHTHIIIYNGMYEQIHLNTQLLISFRTH